MNKTEPKYLVRDWVYKISKPNRTKTELLHLVWVGGTPGPIPTETENTPRKALLSEIRKSNEPIRYGPKFYEPKNPNRNRFIRLVRVRATRNGPKLKKKIVSLVKRYRLNWVLSQTKGEKNLILTFPLLRRTPSSASVSLALKSPSLSQAEATEYSHRHTLLSSAAHRHALIFILNVRFLIFL